MWGIAGACVAGEVVEWLHGELCVKESETSEQFNEMNNMIKFAVWEISLIIL